MDGTVAGNPLLPAEEARAIIAAERGRQFGPDVTDAFLDRFAAFVAIADMHRDRG